MSLHSRYRVAPWPILLLSCFLAVALAAGAFFFFNRSQKVLQAQLREHLTAIAAAAALSIDGDILDPIKDRGALETPAYKTLVRELHELRLMTGMRFAYLMRQTDDENTVEFVADADGALTPGQLDVNGNHKIDPDEEPAFPGEQYDVSEVPMLQGPAFQRPSADESITVDQWGLLISGYAPVYRKDGTVSAVLGVDMLADEYLRLSRRIFSPEALAITFFSAIAIAGAVGILWESRRLRMLESINKERSGLLRLTFHQLGEPLTIMKWSLETLRDEEKNPELAKLVDEHILCMDEGLGRLNSIIDTLQLAEKVELDTLEYMPVSSSLRELLDNSLAEWQSSIQKRALNVQVVCESDHMISMDKTLILLVMRQLLINSIEYSEKGSTISIRVTNQIRSVTVTVEDQGCGIPKEDMKHLFEKYHRATNAHLKKPDGNGLGLYIARGIIEKAGGKMWAESEEGKGTKVHFTLPFTS